MYQIYKLIVEVQFLIELTSFTSVLCICKKKLNQEF